MQFPGTGIFWTSLAAVAITLAIVTVIGRALAGLFPYQLRPVAKFYLSPVLGLSALTVGASLLGRHVAFGDSIIPVMGIILVLALAIAREGNFRQALRHTLITAVFAAICGVSVLVPLFEFGAFNSHNDAFTYLAHSHWLQTHAFGESIPADQVTPLTSQVALYQQGFRMGGSFLLAGLQAMLNLHWAYEAYPAVVISAISACCLAIGFPLASLLKSIPRGLRLLILALPAYSVGGLVFAANYGFLPQLLGQTLGATFLFCLGPIAKTLSYSSATPAKMLRMAFPLAMLFAATVYAYSEIVPFIGLGACIAACILAMRFNAWSKLATYGFTVAVLSSLFLNSELVRAISALRTQSGAVVGTPVDWGLTGFFAHALGLHGGAWDAFQWDLPQSMPARAATGIVTLIITAALVAAGSRRVRWRATGYSILPTAVVLLLFAGFTAYFRYFVPSPFPNGTGQSWSQFKLSDWAHPFTTAAALFCIVALRPLKPRPFDICLIAFFLIGCSFTAYASLVRTKHLANYYQTSDLNSFYLKLREAVLTSCPNNPTVYMALGHAHIKARQMAVLYLYDKDVRSNWTSDGYIYGHLNPEYRKTLAREGDCLIDERPLPQSVKVGPFYIGLLEGDNRVRIIATEDAHDRETDGSNWWHWVERRIKFSLAAVSNSATPMPVTMKFEYATRGPQTLTLRIMNNGHTAEQIIIHSERDEIKTFEKSFPISTDQPLDIAIETDTKATTLGAGDPRKAAWMIRNITISPGF